MDPYERWRPETRYSFLKEGARVEVQAKTNLEQANHRRRKGLAKVMGGTAVSAGVALSVPVFVAMSAIHDKLYFPQMAVALIAGKIGSMAIEKGVDDIKASSALYESANSELKDANENLVKAVDALEDTSPRRHLYLVK